MNTTIEGVISVVLGVLGISIWFGVFPINLPISFGLELIILFVLYISAIYLGFKARKENAQILGIAGLTLGIIGLSWLLYYTNFIWLMTMH